MHQERHDSVPGEDLSARFCPTDERCQALLELSSDWLWEVDAQGVYTFVGDRVRDLLGYKPDEVVGRTPFDFMPPEEGQRVASLFARLAAERKPIRALANVNRHKDGRRVVLETTGVPVIDRQGRFLGYRGLDRDVTEAMEARAAQAAFRESEQRYQVLLESSPVAITVVQGEFIVYANPAVTGLLGFLEAELVGRRVLEVVHPDSRPLAAERLSAVLRGTPCPAQEYRLVRKDGSVFLAESTSAPIRWNGQPAALVFGRDLTERHRLEEQLRQAQKMEAVGQLAGGVAHDFNNTLTGIMMNTYLLKKLPTLSPEARNQIAEVEHAAKRAANLTRQLLLFSRRQAMEFREVDLNQVAENLLKMLRRLLGEHIALTFEPASRPALLRADPGMMEQVIMNLCVNARDAMPEGGDLTLSLQCVELDALAPRAHPDARPGAFIRLSVSDTGCGMDEPTLGRIFEPFFTTKDAGKGTGLGLSTVYGIVKQHQGWVEVESAVHRGSTFLVYLPVAVPQPLPTAVAPETPPAPARRATILLVEDETVVRETLSSFLKECGYEVFEAASGTGALTLWDRHRADISLLFTDVVLPDGLSGLDLVDRFTREKTSLRVLVGSGYSEEVNRQGIPNRPGIHFLPKPYEPATLLLAIRQCLDGTS